MEIRPGTIEDIPAILPMVANIAALHENWDPAKYGYLEHPEQKYGRWLPSRVTDPRSVLLVADRKPGLVAFLVGTVETEIPLYRLKEFGFIHDLWVEEEYRHEGIGRQMMMLAIEQFKKIGVKQIRLDTVMPNEAARNLFKKVGFRPAVIEMLLEI
jgi:ribosomal protein S18 acetylase RimI-like enzyme